jgi:transposase
LRKSLSQEVPDELIEHQIPAEDAAVIRHERFHHPHPHVQNKMEVLLLKSEKLPHHQIARIADVCENTVRAYLEEYQHGGIAALKELHFYKPESSLDVHRDSLESYFQAYPPRTIKEAAFRIKQMTGISRSLTQVRLFFQRSGLKRRKVAAIPAKADPDKQEAFRLEKLEPRLEEARQGRRTVLFVDAAHFVLAPFLGWVWSKVRLFVRAPSGRQRFNVLGALHAITHELLTVTNDSYINAQSVCLLLRKLKDQFDGPITLVLDNAKYQRCALVQEFAAVLGIELLFLPPYSPNLNLIERLWKYTKAGCLHNRYYADFATFSKGITDFLNALPAQHAHNLDSLLTLNFQTFDKETILLAA